MPTAQPRWRHPAAGTLDATRASCAGGSTGSARGGSAPIRRAGGRYEAVGGAIGVWSAPRPGGRALMGTGHFRESLTPCLQRIEIDPGFGLEELLAQLSELERQALGYVKHGA
jgi:hypothetical protein